jgi:hypothetical protein
MGSSAQTAALLLPQFSDNDKPTWRGDVNGAFSAIDAAHVGIASRVTTLETRATADENAFNGNVSTWDKANNHDVFASKYLAGAANDLAALNAARDAAIARNGRLVVDEIGRDWVIDGSLTFDTLTNFSFHMEGRIKRLDNGVNAVSLIYIHNCVGFRAGVIRTNGNAPNNLAAGLPVNEAKHGVRIDGGSDIKIQRIHAYNPSGDGCYITGGVVNVWIGHCESNSDAATGRNTVSVVQADNVTINSVVCRGTGYTTMPGGVDIEPNTGQTVSNVNIGSVWVQSQGTGGFTVVGAYTGTVPAGAPVSGTRQINHVRAGNVYVLKNAGVAVNAADTIFRGVNDCVVDSLTVIQDAASSQVALTFDDCDDVRILDVDIPRAGKNCNIGAGVNVSNLYIKGKFTSASGHCLNIYNCTDSEFDVKLRCLAVGGLLVVQQSAGVSSNLRFKGDWRKGATAGTGVMQVNAPVTDWVLNGCDVTGWAGNRFVGANCATGIKKFNCKGINILTAAPTTNTGDVWAQGDIVWNDTPAAAGPPGWVCTTGGAYGTFVWKAMANLAA